MSSAGPRIVAVLVTHDGGERVRGTIAAVAAQTRSGIDVIGVDNASTDGTGRVLTELLGPERVVLCDRDLGFPAAVDVALDALDAQDARIGRGPSDDDLLLLLHDDIELERDAVEQLVGALEDDPRVAIVGPKLRWADDPTRLQSVGATIDLTGRVDDGIDDGELDQGQRDGDRVVLFVPTAGMLVRRRVFEELGRFDARGHAFREDLDLCWRAAIAGHDVAVVPGAVARHAALASEHERGGRVAELGPRYLAERNTLAALLKNYGPERLLVVLPLALVVGVAKVAGFLLTRRISDARETVAAWGWNLANLRGTLRLRRRVQRMRRRSDAELSPLFGRVTPRLRAYLEAVLERIAGEAAPGEVGSAESQPSATLQGELRTGADDVTADLIVHPLDAEPLTETPEGRVRRIAVRITERPLQTLLPPAVLLLLVGLRDVLLPGPVRGGDLVPFPEGPGLIARHLAGWHDSGATLSALDPSPAQLVLGALQTLSGGGSLRILLVVAPLLAWAATMRALAPQLPGALPRTLLALVYVASPPMLTALGSGDVVTLVVAVLLPVTVAAATTALDPAALVERVWRRLALLAFLLAVAIAFAPPLVLALPLVLLAGVGHALVVVEDRRWRRTLISRVVVIAVLPLPLLGPWLLSLPDVLVRELVGTSSVLGGHPAAWLALAPTGGLRAVVGAALVLAGLAGALVVAAARVGATAYRGTVAMVALALALPLAAWWLDAAGASVRSGVLLVVATATLVGLAALGLRHAPDVLAEHPFGWRQIGIAALSAGTVALTALGLAGLAIGGTPGLTREEAVPAYLASLSPHPPDRILVVGATDDGVVWEVVPASGPDLAAFGVRHDPEVYGAIAQAVGDLLAGSDPRAAARLGRLGIGIVLVPEAHQDARLDVLLRVQSALDPLPSLVGSVSRVSGGIPGVAIVADTTVVGRVPDPSVPPRTVVTTIERIGADRFVGDAGPGGELLAAVPFGAGWRVLADGAALPMQSDDGLIRVLGVPAGAEVALVATVAPERGLLLRGQALWALLVVSLGARPPAFARRNARRRAEADATRAASDADAAQQVATDDVDGEVRA